MSAFESRDCNSVVLPCNSLLILLVVFIPELWGDAQAAASSGKWKNMASCGKVAAASKTLAVK